MSRAKTIDEVRDEFLSHVRMIETKERAVVFSNKTNDVVAVVPIHRLLYIMEA